MIRFTASDKKIQKKLDDFVDDQIPFATSLALNTAVTKVRDNELRSAYSRTFKLRNNQFFKLTHKVALSQARVVRTTGVAIAAIKRADGPRVAGTTERNTRGSVDTSFMEFHVTGGTRRALKAKKAVPITKGRTPAFEIKRSGKTGKISNAKKASTLYKQDRTFMTGKRGDNKNILMVRTGKKTIKAAYAFVPSVTNRAKYRPENIVKNGVKSRIKHEFNKALLRAVKGSRRGITL